MFQDHPHRGQQSAELMPDQLPALGPLGEAQLPLTPCNDSNDDDDR